MRSAVRAFVRIVSLVVPRERRREFRDEWNAELDYDLHTPRSRSATRLVRRASGALPDAVTLFSEQWSFDMLMQDVKYALRLVARRPAFTALIVATLALGMGATTAIFTVVNAVLLRPMPYPEPDRLFVVWEDDRLNGKPRYNVAPGNFVDWQEQSRTFSGFCAYVGSRATLSGAGGEPRQVRVAIVSDTFNDVTGVQPVIGRAFAPDDAKAGGQHVVLLSYAAWRARFGGDPSAVGREIRLDDTAYRVIGVMPRGFTLIDEGVEMWRPSVMTPQLARQRAVHFLTVIGRLAPGVSLAQAAADLDAIAVRAQQQYPATNDKRGVTLVPIAEQVVGDVRRPLYAVAAAVGLVLLIGCANVANLLLAAANGRRRELAVRSALGAGRTRLTRQLLTEGLVLAVLGGAAGLGLALLLTRSFAELAGRFLPRVADLAMDGRVFAFTAAVSVGTGVLFALLPSLHGSRASLRNALGEGGRTAVGRARRRAGTGLVVAELAMAVVLVSGAGLAIRSFWMLQHVPTGFATADVLAIEMSLPASRYGEGSRASDFHLSLLDRLRNTSGIEQAGIVNALPLTGPGPTTWFAIEGAPVAGEPPEVGLRGATPGYFETMRIPVLDGTMFIDGQSTSEAPPIVVNRSLADRFFPGRSPLGVRVRLGPNPKAPWRTIVGVVGDVRHDGPERPPAPEVYIPWSQYFSPDGVVVARVAGEPAAAIPVVRAAVQSLDPQLPPWRMGSVEDLLGESAAARRAMMILLGIFGALAMLLALVGVYGVMAYDVSQRTPEIGVRMALGAERAEVLRMIVRQGMVPALVALGVGIAGAVAAGRAVRSMLFGVEPTDPLTFAVVAVLMLAVTAFACYLPARRAAGIDPVAALRQ
jgi:putative ABC transport system permease protein